MATAAGMSWAQLDEGIKSNRATAHPVALSSAVAPTNGTDMIIPSRPSEAASKALLSDWTRVLDSINEASARAEEREKRLAAQAATHHNTLNALRAELQQTRKEAQAAAMRAQVQITEAEERARSAKERARAAEARAEHAENWLARIAGAVETLLLP